MSKKPITRYFLTVAVVAFLAAFVASDALAVSVGGIGGSRQNGVYSPYWQSDASSYTFISITHPSLNAMASQIGVRVRARGLGSSLTGSSTATGTLEFTINKATTMKVFIAATNNATINSTSITNAAGFIINTANYVAGDLLITPISTLPTTSFTATNNDTSGMRDVTMLTMWGAVVITSSSSGFAMEFVGDLQDSRNPSGLSVPTTAGDYVVSGVN